jgi:hypothetical protein
MRELQAIILCPLQSFEGLASGLEHFSLLSRPEVLCQDNDVAIEGLFQVAHSVISAPGAQALKGCQRPPAKPEACKL